VKQWIIRRNHSVLSATRHKSQLIVRQHFSHHPEFVNEIAVVFTPAGWMNGPRAWPWRWTLFRERVHDKIARLILVILQGCHLKPEELRFMNGKKTAGLRFYPG
jgi:hypothetical protein